MAIRVRSLEEAYPIADFMADTLGKMAEVVVHDVVDLESSIVYIRNGELSGRVIGDGTTGRALRLIREGHSLEKDYIANYPGKTIGHRSFRCSTMLIHDMEDKLIGLLCININVTGVREAIGFLDSFVAGGNGAQERGCSADGCSQGAQAQVQPGIEEVLQGDPKETVRQIVQKVLKTYPVEPERFSRQERIDALRRIDEEGVFLMKGAVSLVASELAVSIPTVYKYLREIQKGPQE